MIALQATSLKILMHQLLLGDTFDLFLLEEATIRTGVTYSIDGHINQEFYSSDHTLQTFESPTSNISNLNYTFQPWSETKGLCFDLIKGKRTPLSFKFVLHVKPEYINQILSNGSFSNNDFPNEPSESVNALVLTIKYDGTKAILTTGTAYKTFVLDKEADRMWDLALSRYLASKEIPFEGL